MPEGSVREPKPLVRLAFFWAIIKALAGPSVEFLLAVLGWLTVLVPCAWLVLWGVARAFDLRWGWDSGVLTVRAVDASLLLPLVVQFLRERRLCAGQGSRRMFYRWFLVGPGLVMVGLLLPAAALSVSPEPMALGWLGAAGLLAFRTFRRLAMLFAEGIGVGWAAATGVAALLLAGPLVTQAVVASAALQQPQELHLKEWERQQELYNKEQESAHKKGTISKQEYESRLQQWPMSRVVGPRVRAALGPDFLVMTTALAFLVYAGGVLGGAVLAGAAAATFLGVAAPTQNALPHFRLLLRLRQVARHDGAIASSGAPAAPSASPTTPSNAAASSRATAP
jgi:hypothetical protein